MRRLAGLVLLLTSVAVPAAAQVSPTPLTAALVQGNRVRVKAATMSVPQRGLVMKGDGGPLTLVAVVASVDLSDLTAVKADGDVVKVPLGSIASVDESTGRRRQWKWGLGIGVGLGVLMGATAS